MKKKNIIIAVSVLVLGGGSIYAVIHHNNVVRAEQLEKQKLDKQVEKEKEALKIAKSAVDDAYKTRSDEEIDRADKAIGNLKDNQKSDKAKLTDKMKKLEGFLKLISDVDVALTKATESKSDADIKSAQSLIDKEIDDYLKDDRKNAQDKLNSLKVQIAKENEEKAAKAAQMEQNEAIQQSQAAATQQNQVPNQQAYQEAPHQNQESNQQVYQETPEQTYQEPAPSQAAPNQQAPGAPSGGGNGNDLPSGPIFNGGSNGSGITDSPGGNDGIGELGPWQ